jgi:signal transduction histidine kinase
MHFRPIFIAAFLLLLGACSKHGDSGNPPVDISDQFLLATSPWEAHEPMDVLSGQADLSFEPLDYPQDIAEFGHDSWLKTSLLPADISLNASILELPGHLFGQVDIWFELAGGQVIHEYAGVRYPYVERKVKHAGVAFNLPPQGSDSVNVLIRIRSEAAMPVNFTALLWAEDDWDNYLFNQRAWYGIFLGAILILSIYNIFLAVSFKDKSYLYYVGYILSLTFVVILITGLAEEYLWPQGKPRSYILMASGLGIFFAVNFVNTFLQLRRRKAGWYWFSTVLSIAALIYGFMMMLAIRVPLIPQSFTATFMHILLVLCGIYFIAVSVGSYLIGIKQARFLALSMLALLSGMVIYFLYTHGLIKYDRYLIHVLELGALIEGVLLSLALSDRINLLTQEKERVEREALASQRTFSKRLIQAQEKDREIFSNTMHDSIGHGMLVLKQNLETLASSQNSDPGNSKTACGDELRSQAEYCGEILDDVRRMSHDLHPHLLRRLGLKSAIESTMDRAFSTRNIEWQADIDDIPTGINRDREITIYRVIQECLNNILKHADASEVMLSLRNDDDTIYVNIKDDGQGFDIEQASTTSQGLHEMRNRIKLFGGRFEIESGLDAGTHIRFEISVHPV